MSSPHEIWLNFFAACEFPQRLQQQYAAEFVAQRIQPFMLKELRKEELRELGVNTLGDQLAILSYIKKSGGADSPVFQQLPVKKNGASTSASSSSNSTAAAHPQSANKQFTHQPKPPRAIKPKPSASSSSSSLSTLQPKSVAIRKPQHVDPVVRRVSGLRSDELLLEARTRRNEPMPMHADRYSPPYEPSSPPYDPPSPEYAPPIRRLNPAGRRVVVEPLPREQRRFVEQRIVRVAPPPSTRRAPPPSIGIRERVTYASRPQPPPRDNGGRGRRY
ncbi:SAM domain-containing protein [Aphelenchoides fujianensis]|nr:SAM domain-containing protein [Aphelenchoides fujianensis]